MLELVCHRWEQRVQAMMREAARREKLDTSWETVIALYCCDAGEVQLSAQGGLLRLGLKRVISVIPI